MNSYDSSRKSEMDDFLRKLYKMSSNTIINNSTIYNMLCYNNLKPKDRMKNEDNANLLKGKYNGNFFDYWINNFKNKKNIDVFVSPDWSYFCQFTNNLSASTSEFIKLYIPIDYDHLYDGANILFNFMERNNFTHLSKISKYTRVDNIIIRLKKSDTETAQKIIDFINNNPYLKSGLNKPNPFIPTINGIGFMQEHGNSYNSDLSYYIAGYINKCRRNGIRDVNAEGFKEFLEDCKKRNFSYDHDNNNFDSSLLDTFNIAYYGKNKNLNSVNSQNQVQTQEESLTFNQKQKLLIDALSATYNKYGMNHLIVAVQKIVNNNNFGCITNLDENHKFRKKLMNNVSSSEVLSIIDRMVNSNGVVRFNNIDDEIVYFCNHLFTYQLPFMLDEICNVTMENHGLAQVTQALSNFINFGNINYFSRFKGKDTKINYRERMKMFDRRNLYNVLAQSLNMKGINIDNVPFQDLPQIYAGVLEREMYSMAK